MSPVVNSIPLTRDDPTSSRARSLRVRFKLHRDRAISKSSWKSTSIAYYETCPSTKPWCSTSRTLPRAHYHCKSSQAAKLSSRGESLRLDSRTFWQIPSPGLGSRNKGNHNHKFYGKYKQNKILLPASARVTPVASTGACMRRYQLFANY